MKNTLVAIVSLLSLTAGCKKGPDESAGKEVVAKIEALHQAMCACKDEACAKKLHAEMDDLDKSGAMKKPTDKQMSAVMESDRGFRDCEKSLVLDETGTLMLKQLTDGLKTAHEKAAKEYSGATMTCSLSTLADFKKTYAGVAGGAQAAFVKAYEDYCTTGMHLEAAEAAVKNAEATKDCGSPNITLAEIKLKDVPGGLEKLAPLEARWTAAGCH
ncbi:hypothetical protein BH11MYX2_BH11MYX2_20810 [soil metagenome]